MMDRSGTVGKIMGQPSNPASFEKLMLKWYSHFSHEAGLVVGCPLIIQTCPSRQDQPYHIVTYEMMC